MSKSFICISLHVYIYSLFNIFCSYIICLRSWIFSAYYKLQRESSQASRPRFWQGKGAMNHYTILKLCTHLSTPTFAKKKSIYAIMIIYVVLLDIHTIGSALDVFLFRFSRFSPACYLFSLKHLSYILMYTYVAYDTP